MWQMNKLTKIDDLVETIRAQVAPNKLLFVGFSGIDGSGKGYVTKRVKSKLEATGIKLHLDNVDSWLTKPSVRISQENPAETFYRYGIRFDEMINTVFKPLKTQGFVESQFNYIEETWSDYQIRKLKISDIEVLMWEGIFLFRDDIGDYFDLKVWVDCTFETALERALARNQEGLSAKETTIAYETIYFPAQKWHFEKDRPQQKADFIHVNDQRLEN